MGCCPVCRGDEITQYRARATGDVFWECRCGARFNVEPKFDYRAAYTAGKPTAIEAVVPEEGERKPHLPGLDVDQGGRH
jgi:hypothetical protein